MIKCNRCDGTNDWMYEIGVFVWVCESCLIDGEVIYNVNSEGGELE